MAQCKYFNKEQIKNALTIGLSRLESKKNFLAIKSILLEEAKNIAPTTVNPKAELSIMEVALGKISSHVDKTSHEQVRFYNDLVTEFNNCNALPRIVDKREIKTDLAKDMNISRETMYKYLRE